jgi:NADH:ubiquinone oxidoreductase subunit E
MDEILAGFGRKKKNLILILHQVQARYGHISSEAVQAVAGHLNLSENEVYGVMTFYKNFHLEPRGRNIVTVCQGTACHVRGGDRLLGEVERILGIQAGETTPDGKYSLDTVNCFGCCAIGPIVVVNGKYYSQVARRDVRSILADEKEAA